MKLAVRELLGTVMEAGMTKAGLLFDSATVKPPEGAGWDNSSKHAVAALGARVVAAHCRKEIVGPCPWDTVLTVTVAPAVGTDMASPAGDAPRSLDRDMFVFLAPGESDSCTSATGPFPIAAIFDPVATQVYPA